MSKLISIGSIIDYTWDHYVAHFKSLMRVTLWFFLSSLVAILMIIVLPYQDTAALQELSNNPTALNAVNIIGRFLGTTVFAFVITSWITIMLLQAIAFQRASKNVDHKSLEKNSWKSFISYVWILFLKYIASIIPLAVLIPGLGLIIFNTAGPQIPVLSALGILLLFIGMIVALGTIIWISVSIHFSEYLLIFENKKGIKALKAAKDLVKGRFWQVLWRVVLPKLLFILPFIFAAYILTFLAYMLIPSAAGISIEAYEKMALISRNLITTIIFALSTPFLYIADYLIYDSLRKK